MFRAWIFFFFFFFNFVVSKVWRFFFNILALFLNLHFQKIPQKTNFFWLSYCENLLEKPPQGVSLKSYNIIFAHDFMCVTLLISRLLGINFIMRDIDPDVTILKFNAQGNKLLTTLLHEFQRRGPSLVAEQKQGITLAPTNMQKFRKWISRSKTTNL
jgi:hypothetical protein